MSRIKYLSLANINLEEDKITIASYRNIPHRITILEEDRPIWSEMCGFIKENNWNYFTKQATDSYKQTVKNAIRQCGFGSFGIDKIDRIMRKLFIYRRVQIFLQRNQDYISIQKNILKELEEKDKILNIETIQEAFDLYSHKKDR